VANAGDEAQETCPWRRWQPTVDVSLGFRSSVIFILTYYVQYDIFGCVLNGAYLDYTSLKF